MNNRKRLIVETNRLSVNSKIKLFNYIKTNVTSNFMENTNGVFFSLTDISDKDIKNLLAHVDELKTQDDVVLPDPIETDIPYETSSVEDNNRDDPSVDKIFDESTESAVGYKKTSFEYDKQMVKEIEHSVNRTNKKSIHVKYSIAKKKYNKQYTQTDPKKFDNTDLKELVEEDYML